MLPQNFDNIDEQLQKLEVICHEATRKYELYLDEFETKTKDGVEITQDMLDKLDKAVKDQKKAVDNQDTLIRLCALNKVDLTTYWIRLGFTESQIQKFESVH
jgi:hypothetical protein